MVYLKKSILACAASVSVLSFGQSAGAQELQLGEIVVTPNRSATELSKTGSRVEVVDRQEIEAQSQPLVIDYLDRLPGISISSPGGPGAEGSLAIRGAPRRYVKTLFNGIDISDPTSTQVQTSYQYLLTGGVDRIEVLKGSQSTLYGSDAIAGVISLNTLGDIEPGISHILHGEVGTRGTALGSYGLRAANADARTAINLTGFRTDGISAAANGTESDGYDNVTFDAAGEYDFNENVSVFGSLLFIDAKADYDDALQDPPADDAFGLNVNSQRQLAGRAGVNIALFDGRFQNTVSLQATRLDRGIDLVSSFGPYSADYTGDRTKVEYQGAFDVTDTVKLQFGADYERQRARFNDDAGSPPIDDAIDLAGGWMLARYEPTDNLALSAGLRHDDHSEFGGETTYRLAGSYQFDGSGPRIYGSVGTGYRAPSIYELLAPALFPGGTPIGNPALQPETSIGFDIGIEQRFMDNRAVVNLTYFDLRIDDLIDCVETEPFSCTYNQVDGTSRHRGVEASLDYQVNNWLALGGAYTYTHAVAETGVRNARIPRHEFGLSAEVKPAEKWTVSTTAKIALDTVDTGNFKLDDYVLLNAKLAYQATENSEFYIRGENLLDQDYQTVRGFNTPGIGAFAGFRATF